MRTTITLDDDVFEAAQAQARASGRRLGEIVSVLARRGLKASNTPSRTAAGLPVFKVAGNAPVIPGGRASEMLSEESQ